MRARCAIALVPLLVTCAATAGCSPGGGQAPRVAVTLSCGMVVDPDATGYFGAPLTAARAVETLTELERGAAAAITKGTLSSTDRRTLDAMAAELIGFSGNKLSDDAAAFVKAELAYSPAYLPVDTSYARPLEADIADLERDCPPAPERGVQRPGGESPRVR